MKLSASIAADLAAIESRELWLFIADERGPISTAGMVVESDAKGRYVVEWFDLDTEKFIKRGVVAPNARGLQLFTNQQACFEACRAALQARPRIP